MTHISFGRNPAAAIARGFSDGFAGIQPVDIAAFVRVQLLAARLAALFSSGTGLLGFCDGSLPPFLIR